ncbi:DUF2244 domain-containing protein [Sandaracinobacter sp. RS1-74]|uniref:DUF2244 domain-containing protein n=1 Tax=Sandaracinobacteroides sayramensis TaxID=2913411 RepID=UPI001EDC4F54|nr:DUF2244 domain-containing protein [Sandaracinobacteroides sayramensis]MCG2840491.1 DUF2244 domain-containing protein [Sandaracinobacteroides sayramensis]
MPPRKPAIFDLELRPSRPMQPRQMWLLLAGVALLFGLMGLRFLFLGAWPILPFMLLDLGLLWWALGESKRSGRQSEHLRLDSDGLELIRIQPHGPVRRMRIEPYWAKVELESQGEGSNRLWLTARGARHPLGAFLSPAERAEIAHVIEDGLARFRAGHR